VLTVAALITGVTPAALADQQIVAGDGAVTSGFSNPQVTMAQGEHLTFRNDDHAAKHNVTAKSNGPDGQPLFQSDTIGAGQTATVSGAQNLKPGTYDFYCTLHPYTMTGTLTVGSSGSPPPTSGGGGGSGGGGSTSGSGTGTGNGSPDSHTKSNKHKRKHSRKHHHHKKR
jgi:plastocyanin